MNFKCCNVNLSLLVVMLFFCVLFILMHFLCQKNNAEIYKCVVSLTVYVAVLGLWLGQGQGAQTHAHTRRAMCQT